MVLDSTPTWIQHLQRMTDKSEGTLIKNNWKTWELKRHMTYWLHTDNIQLYNLMDKDYTEACDKKTLRNGETNSFIYYRGGQELSTGCCENYAKAKMRVYRLKCYDNWKTQNNVV
ncbi:hypothetical protein Trydic_g3226 [Trypoxylus dichotomus]